MPRAAQADAACSDVLAPIRGHLVVAQRAMQPSRSQIDKARAAWAAVPPGCRSGGFYVSAANLLRHPGGEKVPLVADGVRFSTAKEALEAGLSAAPADGELLAYVAYLARVAPALSPALPKDSCARIKDKDPSLRAYVCGVVALAEGRAAEAKAQLGAVTSARFPDLGELLAAAKAPGTAGAPKLGCDPFCPAELWRKAPAKR